NNSFKDRMEIISTVDYYAEGFLDHETDLVISLVPQIQMKTIEVVTISAFVSNRDIGKILLALNNLDKKRNKKLLKKSLPRIMSPELFFVDYKAENDRAVIEDLCDKLEKKGYVNKEFKDSVHKREDIVPTSFEQGLAIPHPLQLESLESKIVIALLEEPIHWGNYDVSLVMLLAINEQDRHILWSFFEWLSEYSSDKESILLLTETQDYESFLELILKD
ncbi:MAG TPA: PTS sugar transporter subunit IIA, partial [Erysipelothrix sp.]